MGSTAGTIFIYIIIIIKILLLIPSSVVDLTGSPFTSLLASFSLGLFFLLYPKYFVFLLFVVTRHHHLEPLLTHCRLQGMHTTLSDDSYATLSILLKKKKKTHKYWLLSFELFCMGIRKSYTIYIQKLVPMCCFLAL